MSSDHESFRQQIQALQADWIRPGPYEFHHPSGWTIVNRIIHGKPLWVLQSGTRTDGAFRTPVAAMQRHAELYAQ
jgi:hypothetical protein